MKRSLFFILILLSGIHYMQAQRLTHGPVIGAVSDRSARIYLRTSSAAPVSLTLTAANQGKITFDGHTDAAHDTCAIIDVSGLEANTLYTLHIAVNGVPQGEEANFKTFTTAGDKTPFVFAFGSCFEQIRTDSIFITILKQHPAFFLQLGDWTYPDHENYPNDIIGGKNHFYTLNWKEVEQVYRVRYGIPNMNKMLLHTPVDFIHDDDDFVYDGNSRYTHSDAHLVGKKTVLDEGPLPEGARDNAIKGYMEFFPHYPIQHDQVEGVYHSFRYGNAEIFFIDSRADRDSENGCFKVSKKGKLIYAPDTTHQMLGKEQTAWLLNGLKNSTADWKFIVSGTNFNMGYHRLMNLALRFQTMMLQPGVTGGMIASMLGSTWTGYPYDQARLINFCADNKIKNVIMLTGDVHSSSIDDGKNSGLPELVGANLGVPNSKIPSILHNKVGLELWDKGGQGIDNDNYNFCFGKVEVFGSDSVKLNVMDMYGTVVTSAIMKNGIQANHVNLNDLKGMTAHTRRVRTKDVLHVIGKVMKHRKKKVS